MFVLDASVTLRWALRDGSAPDRQYADRVLDSLVGNTARVPALWCTETVHVLRSAEDDGSLGESQVTGFLARLLRLPIEVDGASPGTLQLSVASISREFKLSGYDAQYLELSTRLHVPMATLDRGLRKAARKANVAIYLLGR